MVGTLVPGSLLTADIAIVVLDINTPTDRIWFRLAYCDVLILFLQGVRLVHDLSIYIFFKSTKLFLAWSPPMLGGFKPCFRPTLRAFSKESSCCICFQG